MYNCRNCGHIFDSKHCPNCGIQAITKRIDRKYVFHEIQHSIFHFESGFLYTTKELIRHPGASIKAFILGNRQKHYKPIGYVIICSLIYSFIHHYLSETAIMSHADNGYVTKLLRWIPEHYNYSNLIQIIFLSLTLRWFFKKESINYFENFVLLAYLTGFGMLIGTLTTTLTYFTKIELIHTLSPLFTMLYTIWGIGQFYSGQNWATYLKAFFAYLVGFFLFLFSVIMTGEVLNLVWKH